MNLASVRCTLYSVGTLALILEDPIVPVSDPLEQDELQQLLSEIANGQQAALSSLYQSVSARLFGLQLRILKQQPLAEEALQETFLKVWKNAHTYDKQHGSPMTWLNSLARHQALDLLRQANTRAPVNVKIPEFNADTWRSQSREYADEAVAVEELMVCLERLSPESRSCIVSLYCEGYTQEEISESLQRPIGTVKSWIRRGLSSLRECLDEHR